MLLRVSQVSIQAPYQPAYVSECWWDFWQGWLMQDVLWLHSVYFPEKGTRPIWPATWLGHQAVFCILWIQTMYKTSCALLALTAGLEENCLHCYNFPVVFFRQEHMKSLTSSVQWPLQPCILFPAVTTGDGILSWLLDRDDHLLLILLAFPKHLQLSSWGIGGYIHRESEPFNQSCLLEEVTNFNWSKICSPPAWSL